MRFDWVVIRVISEFSGGQRIIGYGPSGHLKIGGGMGLGADLAMCRHFAVGCVVTSHHCLNNATPFSLAVRSLSHYGIHRLIITNNKYI